MKIATNNIITACAASAAMLFLAASCAKEPGTVKNATAKKTFDAWIHVNHPNVKPTDLGVYILEDVPGSGEEISSSDTYAFVHYTTSDLEGTISTTTMEDTDKQLGNYSEGNYYGPDVLSLSNTESSAGVIDMIKGMRIGGTRKAVIPGWLNVAQNYSTQEEYLKNCEGSDMICTLTLVDKTSDLLKWQIDTLEKFSAKMMHGVDSTLYGYYYKQLKEPSDTVTIPDDSTVCINYIGRLMNGKVFDTTIKDTAKFYGIYSSSKTYAPVYIKMNSDYSQITMSTSSSSDGSSTVDGFAYCLSKMKKYEKGITAFFSDYGYGSSKSGNVIPKYAPISFEIEMVDDPED